MTPRVISRTPLLYADGASPELDRPGHVRAGSALVVWRNQLAVIQDDASFVALIDRTTGHVRDVPFPSAPGADVVRQFDDARGNKKSKLDLEASFVFEDKLVAIGSGSSPQRERFVIVEDSHVLVREVPAFYAALRGVFAGELNVEGAVIDGDDLLLFQRGNGIGARNQTARVPMKHLLGSANAREPVEPIEVHDVTTWELPDGLTFTDATRSSDGSVWFLACAEDSPDATRDGPVSAVAVGRWESASKDNPLAGPLVIAPLLDEHGLPLLEKTEGLAFDPDDESRLFVVTDRDDASLPSHLLVVRVS